MGEQKSRFGCDNCYHCWRTCCEQECRPLRSEAAGLEACKRRSRASLPARASPPSSRCCKQSRSFPKPSPPPGTTSPHDRANISSIWEAEFLSCSTSGRAPRARKTLSNSSSSEPAALPPCLGSTRSSPHRALTSILRQWPSEPREDPYVRDCQATCEVAAVGLGRRTTVCALSSGAGLSQQDVDEVSCGFLESSSYPLGVRSQKWSRGGAPALLLSSHGGSHTASWSMRSFVSADAISTCERMRLARGVMPRQHECASLWEDLGPTC